MAKDKGQQSSRKKNPVFFVLGLILIELSLVFFFVPKDKITEIGEKERKAVERQMGEGTAAHVKNLADTWYRAAFIQTGFLHSTYDFLFEQWENEESAKFDDRGLSRAVERRLDVTWLVLYQVFYRAAITAIWLPYLLPFLLVVGVDGMLQREIRKWQFSYASPLAVKGGTQMMMVIFALILLAPFAPISTPPMTMPLLVGVMAMALWVMTSNIQKRI